MAGGIPTCAQFLRYETKTQFLRFETKKVFGDTKIIVFFIASQFLKFFIFTWENLHLEISKSQKSSKNGKIEGYAEKLRSPNLWVPKKNFLGKRYIRRCIKIHKNYLDE